MSRRTKTVFLIILALAALLALASGLTGLEFKAGKPFPRQMDALEPPSSGEIVPGSDVVFNIFRVLYIFAWILFPILLLYILISPAARKMLLKQLARALPFAILLVLFARYLQSLAGKRALNSGSGLAGMLPEAGYPGPQQEFVPSTPSWAVWLASLGISLLVVGIVILILWLYWRRRSKKEPLLRLAEEAQTALDEIDSGTDLRNVVVRCYYEMSDILDKTRGIQRANDMTPHEFQRRLADKGLPTDPVEQLTSLFEEVRYGQKELGKSEEQRAVSSLTAIVQYCRSSA